MSQAIQHFRRRRKQAKPATLHLVSLMDIFTILVFFLLVNSTQPNQVPSNKMMELPRSASEQMANDTLRILITRTELIVNDTPVMALKDIDPTADTLHALAKVLDKEAAQFAGNPPDRGLPATLLSDRDTPYALIKQVLNTANQHHFRNLSLAVLRTPKDSA